MKRLFIVLFLLIFSALAYSAGNDSYTVLLLHCDGTNGSTTFTDSSTEGDDSPHSMTAGDNAQISTAQKKFGTGSGLFDGTDDHLSTGDSNDWSFADGDFTLDFWARWDANACCFIGHNQDGSYHWYFIYDGSNLAFDAFNPAKHIGIANAWSPSADTWYHVELDRNGSSWYMFVDGTQLGSTATDSDSLQDYTGDLIIGAIPYNTSSLEINGYMEEIRISKGIARHTSDFTPPTEEYNGGAGPSVAAAAAIISYPLFKDANSLGRQMINGGMI